MNYDKQAIEDFNRDHLKEYLETVTRPDRRAGKNFYICPICKSGSDPGKEHDGALSYNYNNGKPYCHCFSCQGDHETWDLFSLKARMEGTTNTQAIENAFWEAGLPNPFHGSKTLESYETPAKPATPPLSGQDNQRNKHEFIKACEQALYSNKGKQVLDYLHQRGFNDETIKKYHLGCNFGDTWPLIIPYPGYDYYVKRLVIDNDNVNKYHFEGTKADFYAKEPQNSDITFIVEGQLDAISIMQAANDNGLDHINAIAMGTSSKNDLYKMKAAVFIIACDNDPTGDNARPRIINQLESHGRAYINASWTSQEMKDANEMLIKAPDFFTYDVKNNYERAIESIRCDQTSKTLKGLIQDIEAGNVKKAISTGFEQLDDALSGGLYAGLYFLGALSSIGKTTLLLQVADQIAAQGIPVLYYSLEMSARELVAKSLSRYTGKRNPLSGGLTVLEILHSDYKTMPKDKIEVLKQATKDYEESQISRNLEIIEGVGNIKVSSIKQRLQRYHDIFNIVPVVFIDYLQLIAPEEEDKRTTDKQIIDKTVLELKRLSRDLDTPVIAISSINRASYYESITMSSFKESGAIEYGSDVLLGLQPAGMLEYANNNTEKKYNGDIVRECKLEKKERHLVVNVLKNRNGQTGKQALFNSFPKINLFNDKCIDWIDQPKPGISDGSGTGKDKKEEALREAYQSMEMLSAGAGVSIKDIASYLGKTERQIKNMLKKYNYQVDDQEQVTPPKE